MRISRPAMFMEIARTVAKRSTCARLNVGALVVIGHRVRSMGYNGQSPGLPHCDLVTCKGWKESGACNTIHAERNALLWLPEELRPTRIVKDLYSTDSPCLECFRLAAAYGVTRFFFEREYRINDHLVGEPALEVYRVLPTGYIIDYQTGELCNVD